MKVHLIKEKTIRNFVFDHPASKVSFSEWLSKVKRADWNLPLDIKSTFSSTDILGMGTNRVVFDIGGNKYRMICKYHFGDTEVHLFVSWIGIHAEYDKLCRNLEQYTINVY